MQQPGPYAGTPAYSAPEQIRGQERLASDQYALAVMVYEWITGTRPFTGAVAQQHLHVTPPPMKEVSSTVEAVVLKALAKDPHQRFASVQEFAQAFEQACNPPAPPVLPVVPRQSVLPVGTALLTYTGHNEWVLSVAWSPAGKYIASGSNDGTVQVWQAM
jgi:serine/threonine protein kinase